MSSKIFRSILLAAGVVLLTSLLIIMGCLYEYFAGVQENQMLDELNLAAAAVEESGDAYLDKVKGDEHYRLTWIEADGTVRFDPTGYTLRFTVIQTWLNLQEYLKNT